ncbi:Similar to Yorkie homolog; acc. no. Q2EJA0 [Pyronema omphalodes CBS 100304]|uniref:Similar to Yorkie homolog acc. no. Q2EJA0 n=1 Tax=Pyronema omphalodes (strain CBS 100304) TaxID=1076935 RepID=U4KXS7_PYROM|nr:Similar to Yorkie homolog; acc. no. Q2EJA0 [Pyronema omphalodes CBS 100304]
MVMSCEQPGLKMFLLLHPNQRHHAPRTPLPPLALLLPHSSQGNAVSIAPEAVTDRTSALQFAITISLSIIRDLVYTPFTTHSHLNIRPASRAKPISGSWEKIPLEIRRAFFVNHNAQETTWEDPRGGRNASSYPMRVVEGSKIPDVENKVPLPLGWEQMWYFYERFVDWENDALIWNAMFEHTRRLWQQ